MNCFYCREEIGDDIICGVCGADQTTYRKILAASDAAYNEGLHRAKLRDLSGAAEMLNLSLKYNKDHTDARNLLGLVYFEVGETVAALREWVISKNLKATDNRADIYLSDLETEGTLKKLDQTAHKFNQALSYCLNGSRDLARIQLKRVLAANPKMVKAHQLYALISMQDKKYGEAKKSLAAAARIDDKNPLTMEYQREIRHKLKESGRKKKKRRKNTVDFTDGNDTVIMPRNTVLDIMDNAGSGIINVFVGVVVGVLACVFLVIPQMKQDANSNAASALVSANEKAANSESNVSTLQKQVESLNDELENYTGKADVKTSYEKLLLAEDAVAAGDMESAKTLSTDINRELLDAAGQARYDAVMVSVNAQVIQDNYDAGSAAFKDEDYATAIELLKTVVEADATYDTGYALFYLAQSCENAEQYEDALIYYQQFIDTYEGTNRASSSQKAINRIVEATGLAAPVPAADDDTESSEDGA